jgi:DNA-binding PadR family transcriptional regulator
MSAKHALLGLLAQRSAYPYELADRLQRRLGPAWAINSGQLYQTISRMEKDGLIKRVSGTVDGREDRHVFAITDSGEEEFERWFEDTTTGARLSRRPLLVKITLAGPERLKDALRQIEAYELDRATRLKELSRARDSITAVEGPNVREDQVLLRLNLSMDIYQLEGELRWARHAYEMVSWLGSRGSEAAWPPGNEHQGGSPDEALDDRRGAREELFGRMSARHLRSPSSQEEHGRED